MIKFENTEVVGWEAAIRGMRNPLESWDKRDSNLCNASVYFDDCNERWENNGSKFKIGQKDLALMMNHRNAGTDHRKFMRMIVVYVDITAPLYWWDKFDTYNVGAISNGCSIIDCIHKKEFTLKDFSYEDKTQQYKEILEDTINLLNAYRADYNNQECGFYHDIDIWWKMVRLLPNSYNQKRTVMLNYEVLTNIYHSRKDHKLDEWSKNIMIIEGLEYSQLNAYEGFCDWIRTLPYSELISGTIFDGSHFY